MRPISTITRAYVHATLLVATVVIGGCGPHSSGVAPSGAVQPRSAAQYAEIVSTFTIGTIALETTDPKHNPEYLTRMTALAPEEPAGWANLGLMQLRNSQSAEAKQSLDRARQVTDAPNAGIEKLLGLLADHNGDLPGAIGHYQKAVEIAPDDLRARYSLTTLVERLNTPEGYASAEQGLQAILDRQPYNLVAQADLARIAAKRGDTEALKKAIGMLDARVGTFNADAVSWLGKVKTAAAAGDARTVGMNTQFLANVLKDNSAYQQSYSELGRRKDDPEGEPIFQFIKLPPMSATPAPPDSAITFASASLIPLNSPSKVAWVGAFYRDSLGAMALIAADGREVHFDKGASLPFPGGAKASPPGPHGILAIDLNFDLRNDLVFAGAGGLRFYQQTAAGSFVDVTAQTKLAPPILNAAYTGAWSLDVEADGDLDVVLGVPAGPPIVLRNSVEGAWSVVHPFAGVFSMVDFVWADLDGDGAMDASMIDGQGKLHVFTNQRAGLFQERPIPGALGKTIALSAADINGDGNIDLLALQADGAILRISDKNHGKEWDVGVIARWANPPHDMSPGGAHLLVADLDNNGGLDLIASTRSTAQVWLCDDKNGYAPLTASVSGSVFATAGLAHKGRLDLLGLSPQGQPTRLTNAGTKTYNWQDLRPRAHENEVHNHATDAATVRGGRTPPKSGDRRTNSFGIGGEIEARAGLLYQKQVITSPFVHIGLGSYAEIDACRVLWPNGDVRSEFAHLSDTPLLPNSSITMVHRLKGSCPWVFAWNGRHMEFVTDFLWRSPVGLRINAQDTAGIAQTEDWVKIRGDQLVPRDGFYDVRITAELWETHFFDYIQLMTVDHPAGTEIYVDERFAIPPPALKVHTLTPPKPIARAIDDNGTDVTDIVRNRDGRYLDTFGRGDYQGITRDHYVELELGSDVPQTVPLYLVASGWIHPTDSSINVAISQGTHDPPRGLSLEVPDGRGGWRTAKSGLGFPAGKTKTILIRLDDLSRNSDHASGPPSRVRLRTNLEIYWDWLAVASEVSNARTRMARLAPQTADLRYRGFCTINQANLSSPELPDYEHLDGISQRWRDLIGYCTRFGDVLELLERVDDRYVIMNAGDEMALRFPAAGPPPDGWARDYVLIGDGWEKDGDLNTAFSKTILPLPYHGQKAYNTPPGRQEDDPVVRRHPKDWMNFHTRYISPEAFLHALRPGY